MVTFKLNSLSIIKLRLESLLTKNVFIIVFSSQSFLAFLREELLDLFPSLQINQCPISRISSRPARYPHSTKRAKEIRFLDILLEARPAQLVFTRHNHGLDKYLQTYGAREVRNRDRNHIPVA